MRAQSIIAEYLRAALIDDGVINNVPQTVLAEGLLHTLQSHGLVIVPSQPTAEMRDAADNCEPYATYYASAEQIWDAMLKAAKETP